MKATVTITSRGVVTLPAKLRQALGLEANEQLIAEITPRGGGLLRPAVPLPLEVYTPERVREFDEAEADLAAMLPHLQLAATAPATAVPAAELAWLPEKDRPVLAAAMRLRCDALVIGDRPHCGAGYGRSFGGVTLHSLRPLAERLTQ
jgi:AbrB family looped-hinge helix DNA binding protein